VLAGLAGPGLEAARAGQEAAWRARLGGLLEADPAVEGELRALVAEVGALAAGGAVVQHAAAYDRARQAVLGHGVQNVTFGGHGEPAGG
jgi:hypothetical protein